MRAHRIDGARSKVYRLTLHEIAVGFREFAVVLTNLNGTWKWDYFSALTPQARADRLELLQRKTPVLERLTRELQSSVFTIC